MNEYILPALLFGIASGLKPGPLSLIIIRQSIQHGFKHGLISSFTPIITDTPIIIAAIVLLSGEKNISSFAAFISLAGGVYLLWLSYNTVKMNYIRLSTTSAANQLLRTHSLKEAIKVNILNPNPWLFWFTVGGGYISSGTTLETTLFASTFLSSLVLSKIFVAFFAGRSRNILGSKTYIWVLKGLGFILGMFGIAFLINSYELFIK